eukprot:COSAG02_NODE_46629_length_347_cov_0.850806_1_plen_47_part_01
MPKKRRAKATATAATGTPPCEVADDAAIEAGGPSSSAAAGTPTGRLL